MKKFFAAFLGFVIGFYIFMPKTYLFYYLQNKLLENKIYITAQLRPGPIKLELNQGKIYYKSVNVASFKKAEVYCFIIYNETDIKTVEFPVENLVIQKVKFSHTMFKPYLIKINAKGNFAEKISGNIDLLNKEIKIYFKNIKNDSIKEFLNKDKKGYFYYEKL